MNDWDDLELLELKLRIALEKTDVDEHGNVIERRYLIRRIRNIKIEIYPNEHPPPHFHITSPDINATLSIVECELLTGSLNSKIFKQIKYFHTLNKDHLIEVWNRLRPENCKVGKIKKLNCSISPIRSHQQLNFLPGSAECFGR
jgi:hypothetical protein